MISIHIEGLDVLMRNLDKLGKNLQQYLAAAGKEAASEVITTRGLKSYPPAGPGNVPPTPYWERGVGMHRAGIRKPEYISATSEKYGSQFYVESSNYVTRIGNRSSYAEYLAGERQARAMAKIGWRKLIDVAQEKVPEITRIFQAWIDKLISDLHLG